MIERYKPLDQDIEMRLIINSLFITIKLQKTPNSSLKHKNIKWKKMYNLESNILNKIFQNIYK